MPLGLKDPASLVCFSSGPLSLLCGKAVQHCGRLLRGEALVVLFHIAGSIYVVCLGSLAWGKYPVLS